MSLSDAEGPAVCPTCGNRKTAAPRFSFDARRWTLHERIAAAATVVLLISLWQSWFAVTLAAPGGPVSLAVGALDAHGFLWAAVVASTGILAFIVLRACREPVTPLARRPGGQQLLTAASAVSLILVVMADVATNSGAALDLPDLLPFHWRPFAFVALGAATVAAVAVAFPAGPPSPRRRWSWPERVTGAASLLLLAALTLDWFGPLSFAVRDVPSGDILVGDTWLWSAAALAVGVLALLALRVPGFQRTQAGATTASLLLVLLAFDLAYLHRQPHLTQLRPGAFLGAAGAAAAAASALWALRSRPPASVRPGPAPPVPVSPPDVPPPDVPPPGAAG